MGILPRRIKPPTALRKSLVGDERFLAIADSGDRTVAATQSGLWLPAESGWRRLYWDRVVKATWTGDAIDIIEGEVDDRGLVHDLPPFSVRLTEPRNLPPILRKRVEQSIARWEQVKVPGGTGRIIARKRAGVDGLEWTARLDSGTPDTPEARQVLVDYLGKIAALSPEQLVQS